ncbi:hypothetical protein [Croceicoccus pelagius]|uniref:Uncharacterized protein n=1 Tax=Croceicoccus pelagius TaxID=1703341 RepID=A0A917DH74_9SPHN|nr:hypothetical protein [Croceicoccus pelagius]GGD35217.1 hypothetical protein GCM10010989_06720 [Croceicoccus pelagius]
MVTDMFENLPNLPLDGATEDDRGATRRIDWHALLSRLQAERDLRASLEDGLDRRGLATLITEGSFDPHAAEMLFALAAGAGVPGDTPERRFLPEDLAALSQQVAGAPSRLRNPKSSDCKNPSQTTERVASDGFDFEVSPKTSPSSEGNA